MAITPLNQGGTGADLSGTGGANEFVKQTAAGANFSVATLTTSDVASVGIVKSPTAAQTIAGKGLSLTPSAPLTIAQMENVQYVDSTLSRGGVDIGDEINRAYAQGTAAASLGVTAASVSGGVATLTMSSNPSTFGFVAGQYAVVFGFTPSTFNGVFVLSSVTSTQIQYAFSGSSPTGMGAVSVETGVTIYIAQPPQGVPGYNFTTPIVLATPGRYARLEGLGPGVQAAGLGVVGSQGGVTLNYTLTSGTAVTLDYVPVIGGGHSVNHGIFHLDLVNNINSSTNKIQVGGPGSGSSAVGLQLGGTNSGIQNGTIQNVRVTGFNIGEQFTNGAGISWGVNHINCSFQANNVGVNFASAGIESIRYSGCQFVFNSTGVSTNFLAMLSTDVYYFGCSFDTNTVWAINTTGGGQHDIHGCHFENLEGVNPQYTTNYIQTDGYLNIHGGYFIDDNSMVSVITNVVETAASVVTLTLATGVLQPWASGQNITLSGLTTATWLNNEVVTLLSGTNSTTLIFNDPTSHGAQASHSESGNAISWTNAEWISLTSTACICHIFGTLFYSGGRITSALVNNAGTIVISANILSPTRFTSVVTGGSVMDLSVYNNLNASTTHRDYATLSTKRLVCHQGTQLTSSNFSFSQWGTGATVSVVGTDQAYQITLTAGTSPSANPQFAHNYADGPFSNYQVYVSQCIGGTGFSSTPLTPQFNSNLFGTFWTYQGPVTPGKTYVFNIVSIGT